MILINLFSGPGGGKTTLAAYLFYRFKQAGFRAELVGEVAREIIYDRNTPAEGGTPAQLIDNQLLISGLQYERLKRLERHGIEVAIADSPLRMGLVYAQGLPEHAGLTLVVNELELLFPHTVNVYVQRTAGKALRLDDAILRLGPKMDFFTGWGGEFGLADCLIEEAKRGRT